MTSEPTRRFVTTAGLAALGLAVRPAPARALTEARARALVEGVVQDINRVIASGRSLGRMISEFERIFARYADVSIIARSTLGPAARRASAAQLRAYTEAFRSYVARKYGKRFREFIGGRLEVTGVKRVKRWYEVSCVAHLRGEAPFEVTFLVSDRGGRPLFFNLYIEGINMLLTERTEVGAMLDRRRGDIDKLVADLKKAG